MVELVIGIDLSWMHMPSTSPHQGGIIAEPASLNANTYWSMGSRLKIDAKKSI